MNLSVLYLVFVSLVRSIVSKIGSTVKIGVARHAKQKESIDYHWCGWCLTDTLCRSKTLTWNIIEL